MLKVGNSKPGIEGISYADIEHLQDPNGWYKAADVLPRSYDLCVAKMANGKYKKCWYTGNGNFWDGYKINPEDIVVKWKKIKDE